MREQWEIGDPATRESAAEALRAYVIDNPDEDSIDKYSNKNFQQSLLTMHKKTSLVQFITRCMDCMGFSARKCCIGQAVPDDWCEKAIKAAKEMREAFKDGNADAAVNTDQTFAHFHPESDYEIAPKNAR